LGNRKPRKKSIKELEKILTFSPINDKIIGITIPIINIATPVKASKV
jgi:hypothetical protein